jgi:hypothetical protein
MSKIANRRPPPRPQRDVPEWHYRASDELLLRWNEGVEEEVARRKAKPADQT